MVLLIKFQVKYSWENVKGKRIEIDYHYQKSERGEIDMENI